MARPQKKPKMNSTALEDLNDHMLTEILCRLPSCASTIACKPVNKRWCSLISDPKFGVYFSHHKMENTTLSALCPDIDDDEPPWTFIASMESKYDELLKVCNASNNRSIFASSKFSLNFLPPAINIEATFKDLVLCSDLSFHPEGGRIYYLCNPLTKEWVTLPPCPGSEEQWYLRPWTGLICEHSYDYTRDRDNKFRVVVVRQGSCGLINESREYKARKFKLRNPMIFKLWVYCSEIGKWKKIKLSVAIRPELVHSYDSRRFENCIVCNGVIYIKHDVCLAGLDPFNVNETCDTTINARVMPTLPVYGSLRESAGKLFTIYDSKSQSHLDTVKREEGAMKLSLIIWKLDPDQLPLKWNTTFEGLCTSQDFNPNSKFFIHDFRMHPYDDRLVYMYLGYDDDQQLALCDTRSRCITPLKSLLGYNLMSILTDHTIHRLELQWWPTSVHTATPLNNASQWRPTSFHTLRHYSQECLSYWVNRPDFYPTM